jgi:hypothetical protein
MPATSGNRGKRRKIITKIDMGELITAFESAPYEKSCFLDLDTGELELIIEEIMDDAEIEEVERKIASNPARYVRVPQIEAGEAYQDLADFAGTVSDGGLRESLLVALRGKGAFRRFKEVLSSYPRERERCFSFKDQRMAKRVKEWLKELGVEYSK